MFAWAGARTGGGGEKKKKKNFSLHPKKDNFFLHPIFSMASRVVPQCWIESQQPNRCTLH
jgi:hypothetical protein